MEKMCPVHFVPACRLCEVAPATPAPVAPLLDWSPAVIAVPLPEPPPPPPEPELTDPRAKKAMELAQAYEAVGVIQNHISNLRQVLASAEEKLASAQKDISTLQKELMEKPNDNTIVTCP